MRSFGMDNSTKFDVRLIPPILDVERRREAFKSQQWPGMSAHDVEAVATNFNELRTTFDMLAMLIGEARREPYNWRSSTEKLAQLKARLRIDDRKDDPTAAKPAAPPRPSRSIRKAERKKLWKKPKEQE